MRIASPRAPPTSRCAAFPRRYVTGKISLGANQRNATSGIAMPRIAANSPSEGCSTPRYSRASTSSPIRTPPTHFATERYGPLGTSAYVMPTSVAANPATGIEGIE